MVDGLWVEKNAIKNDLKVETSRKQMVTFH